MKFSLNRLVTHGFKHREHHPANAWMLSIVWLLAIGFLAFFWHLGSTGLLDETEPLFAEASRQMVVTGDWITPFFNQETRFDKPPLIYWCQAISYMTFGVNSFAVRFPSALAGLVLAAMVFYTLRNFGSFAENWGQGRQGDNEDKGTTKTRENLPHAPLGLVASMGAAMVALNPLTLFFGRTGYSDMLLSACMGGGLLAFFAGYAQPERPTVQARWYLAFYVLIGLAVLTKGPVGMVVPGLIVGSFLLYVGRLWEVLREMHPVRGALIILAINLPWYVLVTLRNGEAYINSFFGYHNFERFTSVVNEHRGPWYFHILIVLVGFFPWSLALPMAIARVKIFQRRHWQQLPRSAHLGVFALTWFLAILGFFTVAVTKYFSYTLPLMPAAAILVSLWWGDCIFQQRRTRFQLVGFLSIFLFLVLAAACFHSPQWLGDDPTMPNLGVRVNQAGLSWAGAAIWGASAIATAVLLLRRQTQWLWGVKFLGFVAFLICVIMPAWAIVDAERQLPLRQIAQSVVEMKAAGEEAIMIENAFEKPSLVFYTQQPVTFLQRSSEAIPYIRNAKKTSSPDSVLLIATRKALEKTELEPNQYQELDRAGIYELVRVSREGIL